MSEAAETLPEGSAAPEGTQAPATTQKPDLTIVDDEGIEPTITAPAAWPEDWRDRLANKDEKALAKAKRYSSPENVFKALLNAEKKISEGIKPAALAKDATEEQVAEFRAANGIPETPEKYDTNIGDGVVWGDDDKPLVDSFLKAAHGANFTPEQAKVPLAWYHKFQEEQAQAQFENDERQKIDNTVSLREEWGVEYKSNINAVKGWIDSEDPELSNLIFGARAPDGGMLGNNPAFIKLLVNAAKAINPAATLIPGQPGSSAQGVEEEIASIKKKMGTPEYTKDTKLQERYRQLLDARERMSKR